MEQQRLLPEIRSQMRRRKQQRAHLPQPQLEDLLTDNVSAAEMQILEKIFTAEIEGRLPAQLRLRRSYLLERLERRKMIQKVTMTLSGGIPVTVEGWELTHFGRMTYCASC
jgi:hypothetical protein